MSFTKVCDVLSDVATRSGDPIALDAARVVEIAKRELSGILGEKSVESVKVKSYKDGVLTLAVTSSVWAHEVRMMERRLISKLNEILLTEMIKKVRYWVG